MVLCHLLNQDFIFENVDSFIMKGHTIEIYKMQQYFFSKSPINQSTFRDIFSGIFDFTHSTTFCWHA